MLHLGTSIEFGDLDRSRDILGPRLGPSSPAKRTTETRRPRGGSQRRISLPWLIPVGKEQHLRPEPHRRQHVTGHSAPEPTTPFQHSTLCWNTTGHFLNYGMIPRTWTFCIDFWELGSTLEIFCLKN